MSTPKREPDETPTARKCRIAEDFELALKGGQEPRIEDYLEQVSDAERPALLAELICDDHVLRWERGELPLLTDYKARFPDYHDTVERAFFRPKSELGVRYAFIEKLGQGGQAAVYLASDTDTRQAGHSDYVAIKVFESVASGTRFEEEKRLLGKTRHQNVVPILDAFEHAGRRFIVLDYIHGPTLAEKVKNGPLEPAEAAKIIAKVARAVEHVHRKTDTNGRAVVHRDLKPANIILDDDGDPHVLDFGLACLTKHLMDGAAGVGGTFEYMSPEQVRAYRQGRGTVDTRSDVWALGAVLFEMLTGQPPFGRRPPPSFDSPDAKAQIV